MIPEDIKALTGVRLFAALWVVLYHFRDGLKPIAIVEPFMPLINDGYLAVPMFFILSGFILSHTYFPHYSLKSHPKFVYRRLARLWPVHMASLIALMMYIGVMVVHSGHFEDDGHTFAMAHVPGELVMVRSWFSKDLVWNYPAWSIHAEWFAYLFLFPVACLLFRTIQKRWILLLIASALLAEHTFLPIAQLPGMCAEVLFLFLTGSALYRLRI
ncbi:MAG: acyltransferase [Nitrospira sp.]|nr:acyltransferase [Nitrospira sp.]